MHGWRGSAARWRRKSCAPGELSASERELLFAFGSGVTACHFCVGAHRAVAERMGVAPGVIEAALIEIASAPVDERLKPLLHFVKKLTETPSRIADADPDAVRAAGWSDAALHEVIVVCALQNFFNRWVDGAGGCRPRILLPGLRSAWQRRLSGARGGRA
ncbi:MAG: carboxymuconolactone decarboxylase family protein [Gammaproteobacteria bacterium]|nr:carboxymuconolactone decarboxylase family protein [Gammaproteobacteria bacterium]